MCRIIFIAVFFFSITSVNALAALPTQITSIAPANGATGISTGPTISVVFNTPMTSSTITTTNFYLTLSGTSSKISGGTVAYNSTTRIATLTFPSGTLALNTAYTINLTKSIKTSASPSVAIGTATYSEYSFTTVVDDTPPTVVSVVPANNATGVALTAVIDVTFSDLIDITTLTSSSFLVNGGVTPASIVQFGGAASKTYRYTPAANLAYNTLYTITLKAGIKNVVGLSMAADYPSSFRTLLPDTTPPTVTVVSPAASATGIALNSVVTATFSEPMTPERFTVTTFKLTDPSGGTVSGTVGYNTTTQVATFTPDAPLQHYTVYTATVTTGVSDQSDNYLAAAKVWSFTTTGNYTVNPVPLNNYCQIPPFVTSGTNALKPNVLLMVDNSGSMNEFTYKAAGMGGGINQKDTSYNANSSYYGYFDYGKMYSYNTTASGYFYVDGTKTLDKTSFWSGNFLNWLTMRKVDLVRKVLVGGKTQPRSANVANYLYPTSNPDRDFYKAYGSNYYYVDDKIYVCANSNCSSYNSANNAPYNLKIYVGDQLPQEGLLLQMQDRINFGIMFFNDGYRFEDNTNSAKDGGNVAVDIGATGTNLITQVENTDPATWTPLAETFYEATRYFQATTSAYNGGTYSGKDPITASCMKNFVLILTDGESTKDQNVPGTTFTPGGTKIAVSNVDGNFNVQTYMTRIATNEGTPSRNWSDSAKITSEGSWYLPGVALWAHTTDLRSATIGKSALAGMQNLTTYVVYAFDDNANAREMLKLTAKYGGFEDAAMTSASLPDSASKWDINSDGVPDTYYEAQQGDKLESALQNAFNDILSKVSSGTSASIVNNRGESGANLFQAVFYPKKSFGSTDLYWIGELQNMWYYLDPLINTSSIREDTNFDGALDLKTDYKVTVDYDTTKNQTVANWYRDTSGLGTFTFQATGSPDNIHALWRAGGLLQKRTADSRTIKTTLRSYNGGYLSNSYNRVSVSGYGFTSFVTGNSNNISDYLNVSDVATGSKLIDYVRGVDYTTDPAYRSRTVTITYPNTNPAPLNTAISGVWKLGDIVASTPQPQTSKQLQAYDTAYRDTTYSQYYNSAAYQSRNMVYTAANDGMLHAFRIGQVARTAYSSSAPYRIAQITNPDTTLYKGDEEWAFVPKNALPYLKYLSDPTYNHLFYVNNTVTLLDASINRPFDTAYTCTQSEYWKCEKKTTYSNSTTLTLDEDNTSWRTVLIGGMGLGGASRDYSGYCNKADGTTPTASSQETRLDCVKSPVADVGLSSFFALDVTTPKTPRFMWEFSDAVLPTADKGLGYSTSGPSIVRVSTREPVATATYGTPNLQKNGRWFAVFATGPSGPIDTTVHQFRGRSDSKLKVYVVDIHPDMSHGWVNGTNYWVFDSGIYNAFAGDMTDTVLDVDRWNSSANGYYSDDVVYIGFTRPNEVYPATPVNWTNGGVLRLLTNDSTDPANWTLSTMIDGIGPVTASPAKLQDRTNGNLWLLFGTGRYFYKDTAGQDDPTNLRYLIGVKEPCYAGNMMNSGLASGVKQGCAQTPPAVIALSDLQDQSTTIVSSLPTSKKGWYITLDPAGNYALGAQMVTAAYDAERVVTNTTASFNGVAYFTTFKPTDDLCGYGGSTQVWMVDYLNGGVPPAATMKGKLLIQLSGGEFVAIDVASASKSGGDAAQQTRGDRRTRADLAGHGIAGSRGGSLQSLSKPIRKILHIIEK